MDVGDQLVYRLVNSQTVCAQLSHVWICVRQYRTCLLDPCSFQNACVLNHLKLKEGKLQAWGSLAQPLLYHFCVQFNIYFGHILAFLSSPQLKKKESDLSQLTDRPNLTEDPDRPSSLTLSALIHYL